jgi:hypothetical protein
MWGKRHEGLRIIPLMLAAGQPEMRRIVTSVQRLLAHGVPSIPGREP